MSIVNTFVEDGYAINYDFAWHLAYAPTYEAEHRGERFIPGQDYKVRPGAPVRAGATGNCSWADMDDGLYLVSIQYGADAITYRELASVSAAVKSGHITQGAVIGTASTTLSPHWEYDHANGTYSPVENFITPAPSPAPTPEPEEEEMKPIAVSIKNAAGAWTNGLLVFPSGKVWPFTDLASWSAVETEAGVSAVWVSLADFNAARALGGLPAITA